MKDNIAKLGSGWFLKQGKHMGTWLVDPFTLYMEGEHLVAARDAKRFLILKQADYDLIHLNASPLRSFRQEEFTCIIASTIGEKLDNEFKLSTAKCFDIRFGTSQDEKMMTVFGISANETERLFETFTRHAKPGEDVECICAPLCHPELDDILADSPMENEGAAPLVISTRLTMPLDQFDAAELLDLVKPTSGVVIPPRVVADGV